MRSAPILTVELVCEVISLSVFPAYTTVPTSAASYQRAVLQGATLLALAGLIVAQLFRPPVIVYERPAVKQVAEVSAPRVVVTQLEVEPLLFGRAEIPVRLGAATFTATRTAMSSTQGVYEVRLDEGRIMKLYVKPITRGKKAAARRA